MASAAANDFIGIAESVRWVRAEGAEPEPPVGFGPGQFTLPEHYVKPLERSHPHERDSDILFKEKPHIYMGPLNAAFRHSVTHYAHLHSTPFVEKEAYRKMCNSFREAWPRKKYALGVEAIITEGQLSEGGNVIAVENGATIFASEVPAGPDRAKWIHNQARRKYKGGALEFFRFERAMTMQEVFDSWELNRTVASNKGTHSHHMLELWANSLPSRVSEPETQNGIRFIAEQLAPLKAKAFRTEWEIYNDYVAGSIDLVLILPDGSLIVCDWKRATKHDVWHPYNTMMKAPFGHLDDTPVAGFALQLGLYKYILEHSYGYKVAGLVLCGVEPDNVFSSWVPYLDVEVEYLVSLMKERRGKEVRCEHEFPDAQRCELTKLIAWEPMRIRRPDGTLSAEVYDRPQALGHFDGEEGITLEKDADLETAVNTMLNRVSSAPNAAMQRLLSRPKWRSFVPQHGFTRLQDVPAAQDIS